MFDDTLIVVQQMFFVNKNIIYSSFSSEIVAALDKNGK